MAAGKEGFKVLKIPCSSVGDAEAKDFMCTSLSLPICGVPPWARILSAK